MFNVAKPMHAVPNPAFESVTSRCARGPTFYPDDTVQCDPDPLYEEIEDAYEVPIRHGTTGIALDNRAYVTASVQHSGYLGVAGVENNMMEC